MYNVVVVSGEQQSVIHISTLFQMLFPYRPLQSIEQSSLCYTVGPYQISILYIVMSICQSQPFNLSLPLFPSVCVCVCVCLVAQLCLPLCDPMDWSPPGSPVHEILQAGILERVAIPFSRGSSPSGIKPGTPTSQADSAPSELPRKPW